MVCTVCHQPFDSTRKNQKRCSECSKYSREKWAEKSERRKVARNTQDHRAKCRARNNAARDANNALLLKLFGDGINFQCHCGFTSPIKRQFDFHHTDPEIKTIKFTRALRNKSFDLISAIDKEKVVLKCTNCHRKEHFKDGKHAESVLRWLKEAGVSSCQICGELDQCTFEFHHLSPEQKGQRRTLKCGIAGLNEAMRCALICARCHRAIDSGVEYDLKPLSEIIFQSNQIPQIIKTLRGRGHRYASGFASDGQRLTVDEFIRRAKLVHRDAYSYEHSLYVNSHTKVLIRCVKHDLKFEQRPNAHLSGKGCPKCARERTLLRLATTA
jgi:hypothetical protein